MTGLEPTTPWSQTRCSSQLNYISILPVPNHSVLVPYEDFHSLIPVIPLSDTLHVLYLEFNDIILHLLILPPCGNTHKISPIFYGSHREYWVTHDISLSSLSSVSLYIVLGMFVLGTSAFGVDTWTLFVSYFSS